MKTTIEIPDSLMQEAKACAQSRGVPLRQIVEEGVRFVVAESRISRAPFKLRDGSFRGDGMATNASWDEIRDLIYEGRGT